MEVTVADQKQISPSDLDEQVKSKQRVADHGEVFTSKREVNAMLDLVKQETERIESRFLEPACGTGNFLVEILRRKLDIVQKRYQQSQYEYERNAVVALSSIYGIDILEDNVKACRDRLFGIFESVYLELFKNNTKDDCRASVKYILSQNIIHGDALSLKTVGDNPQAIIFAEWSPINGSMIKRRDFSFSELMSKASLKDEDVPTIFDIEDTVIPIPIKDYPPIHFLELSKVDIVAAKVAATSCRKEDKVDTTSCRIEKEKHIVAATSCRKGIDKHQDDVSTMDVSTIKHQDDVSTMDVSTTDEPTWRQDEFL